MLKFYFGAKVAGTGKLIFRELRTGGKSPVYRTPAGLVYSHKTTHKGAERKMKGYYTQAGYWGYCGGKYMLFASEEDFRDFMED